MNPIRCSIALVASCLSLLACGDDSSSGAPDAGPPPGDSAGPDLGPPSPVPPTPPTPPTPPAPGDAGADAGPPGPLSIGLVVHLEALPWHEPTFYDRFREQLVAYGEQLQSASARATFEARFELTSEVAVRSDTLYSELEAMGHAVGVHADLGGAPSPMYDQARFASDLLLRYGQLGALGIDVRHVSGVCSHLDWVAASIEAGFRFTSGTVAYCLMSLPEAERPASFRMCASAAECHERWPETLSDRLQPWRVESGADWTTDSPDGRLVVLPAGNGLPCAEEERGGGIPDSCTLTPADIDLYFADLETALASRAPGRVNVFYTSWSWGRPVDTMLLDQWLERMQPYLDDGRVEWRTLPQMYDDYVAWEAMAR
ncbi:MAG: hypothetical protein IT379_32570 [Deltaproteobacteria bacterium]|nr:hypothetical protein [Deltaproteobacteria bacterium]